MPEIIKNLFVTVFEQPIFNLLVFFYNVIPGKDIGLAIIAITIILKIVLYPFSLQAIKSQKALQDLQPKLKALQEELKADKEKLARATMELYAKEKVSPFSSCLPLLIQFPFLIALYQAMRFGLASQKLEILYPFVSNPGTIDPLFLGFLNLAAPSIPLAVIAGAAQFWQTKMLQTTRPPVRAPGSKDEDTMARMNKQMTYMMPVMTVVIGASLPGGLALYWLMANLITVAQQMYFFKKNGTKAA